MEFGVVVRSPNFSCSGVILDGKSGLILTVGSIANGLVNETGNEFEENNLNGADNETAVKLGQENVRVQVVVRRGCKNGTPNASKDDFLTLRGSVIAIWRDKNLYEIQKKIFPEGEWTFESGKMDENEKCENSKRNGSNENNNSRFSLADFALIKVIDLDKYMSGRVNLICTKFKTGDPLSIIGTPFGSECYHLFFNCLSKGIVSNTIGSSNEMILTDARCVPGSEGCPVFIESSQPLHKYHQPTVTYEALTSRMTPYGIVVAPFCWRSGEWIGLTLVCSIRYILQSFIDSNILSLNHPSCLAVKEVLNFSTVYSREIPSPLYLTSNPYEYDHIQTALSSVVLVQAGSSWGSGIIIDSDKGLVITCRHILTEGGVLDSLNTTLKRSYVPLSIHGTSLHRVHHTVDILFATESDCSLDFALLRVKNHSFKTEIKIDEYCKTSNLLTKGSDIVAVGHSLFGYKTRSEPCVTTGTISNVSFVNGTPVMLQTTAAVHGGGSGGAIISRHTGQLLGMVTCNIKDGNSSSSFPHVNFSIPVNMIHKLIGLLMYDESKRSKELFRLVSGADGVWCLDSRQTAKSKL